MNLRLLLFISLALVLPARAQDHPRLFVTPARIEQVRAAIRVPGSHHQEAFDAMKARVEQANWRIYNNGEGPNWNYARSYLAREAALAYLLTSERKYAQIAFDALEQVHTDPDPDKRLPESGYGLSRATVGMGFAIAYDWAYEGLTPEQRAYLLGKIRLSLDEWLTYRHANLETEHMGSNWVAVCRGGELVMMLAAREEGKRQDRFEYLKHSLGRHLETAYGETGWSQEGYGYTSYAGQFLLPAVYALQDVGDHSLDSIFTRRAFYRYQMGATSFTRDRLHLMSGVDGGFGYDQQGWISATLRSVPADILPEYTFFYDRAIGRLAPGTPARRYDPVRAGTTWALLFYPEKVAPRDPDDRISRTTFDLEKGLFLFRNQWQDSTDVLVSFMGDFTHHGHAWDIQEATQLGLILSGVPFIGAPGKDGTSRTYDHTTFSGLLVDGKAFEKGRTGRLVRAGTRPNGAGYAIIDGGEKYAALGVDRVRRHVAVEFGGDGTTALATMDVARDDSDHTFTWQLAVGEPHGSNGIRVEQSTEAGLPVFLLTGPGGTYLKGWVLTGGELTAGDPVRINVRGSDVRIRVAMIGGTGTPPSAAVTSDHSLAAGRYRFTYDADRDRIIISK